MMTTEIESLSYPTQTSLFLIVATQIFFLLKKKIGEHLTSIKIFYDDDFKEVWKT